MAAPITIQGWYHLRVLGRTRRPSSKSVALHTHMKKQADEIAAKLQRRWLMGEYDPWTDSPFVERKGIDSLADAAEAFLESRSELRPASIRSYRLMVRQLLGEVPGAMSVRDLSEGYLKAYFQAPGLSAASRQHRYRHAHVLGCANSSLRRRSSSPNSPTFKFCASNRPLKKVGSYPTGR